MKKHVLKAHDIFVDTPLRQIAAVWDVIWLQRFLYLTYMYVHILVHLSKRPTYQQQAEVKPYQWVFLWLLVTWLWDCKCIHLQTHFPDYYLLWPSSPAGRCRGRLRKTSCGILEAHARTIGSSATTSKKVRSIVFVINIICNRSTNSGILLVQQITIIITM